MSADTSIAAATFCRSSFPFPAEIPTADLSWKNSVFDIDYDALGYISADSLVRWHVNQKNGVTQRPLHLP